MFTTTADIESDRTINSFTLTIKQPDNSILAVVDLLPSSGNTYSGSVNINSTGILCLNVGTYILEYLAVNDQGLNSNLLTSSMVVLNTANQPPIISGLNVPDSVIRPTSGSFDITISLDAIDPDGECNLKEVTFLSYRPTGNPTNNGIPLDMIKLSGSQYSYTAPVFPAAEDSLYGYYKYYFTASDFQNIQTTVVDSIKFVRP